MSTRLSGKVAIVTGGANGQGKASSQLFASEGAKVVVADWDFGGAQSVAKEIKSAGGEAVPVRVDVSNEEDIKNMVAAAQAEYGSINVLFNNAGVGLMRSIVDMTVEEWNRILAIDLTGAAICCKHVIPGMIAAGGGAILNNSSMAAITGGPAGGVGVHAYAAAKGGLIALTRSLATSFGPNNIRVNCICPGIIDTAMIPPVGDPEAIFFNRTAALSPLGHRGTVEEIAETALFLVSDASSHITGVTLPVDGGITIASLVSLS